MHQPACGGGLVEGVEHGVDTAVGLHPDAHEPRLAGAHHVHPGLCGGACVALEPCVLGLLRPVALPCGAGLDPAQVGHEPGGDDLHGQDAAVGRGVQVGDPAGEPQLGVGGVVTLGDLRVAPQVVPDVVPVAALPPGEGDGEGGVHADLRGEESVDAERARIGLGLAAHGFPAVPDGEGGGDRPLVKDAAVHGHQRRDALEAHHATTLGAPRSRPCLTSWFSNSRRICLATASGSNAPLTSMVTPPKSPRRTGTSPVCGTGTPASIRAEYGEATARVTTAAAPAPPPAAFLPGRGILEARSLALLKMPFTESPMDLALESRPSNRSLIFPMVLENHPHMSFRNPCTAENGLDLNSPLMAFHALLMMSFTLPNPVLTQPTILSRCVMTMMNGLSLRIVLMRFHALLTTLVMAFQMDDAMLLILFHVLLRNPPIHPHTLLVAALILSQFLMMMVARRITPLMIQKIGPRSAFIASARTLVPAAANLAAMPCALNPAAARADADACDAVAPAATFCAAANRAVATLAATTAALYAAIAALPAATMVFHAFMAEETTTMAAASPVNA